VYSPSQIVQRAARSYGRYLRSILMGEPFFPLFVPFGKTDILESDFATLQKEFAELRASTGFLVDWEKRVDHRWGLQEFPARIYFDGPYQYLKAIGKQSESDTFLRNVQLTRSICPELESWLANHIPKILNNAEVWPDILKVCRYFLDHPRPQRFVRELPIAVDTKFIERNEAIIAHLLSRLIPDSFNPQGRSFEEKFGLQADAPLIRVRVLDEDLNGRLRLPFPDVSVPIEHLSRWDVSDFSVVITENKVTFLTLPALQNAIGIWGGGGAASLLFQCHWLDSCRIIYWGDIDVSGFEILNRLRHRFAHIESVMMDEATLSRFRELAVGGKKVEGRQLDDLTSEERPAFKRVQTENIMLEQERLPSEWTVDVLRRTMRPHDTDTTQLSG
jgi:hypothetical protein